MSRPGPIAIWLLLSLLWIGGTTPLAISGWGSVTSAADQHHSGRVAFCRGRYGDAAARQRCIDVMDLERFQDLAKAVFNRVLLVLGPPGLGLGVLVWFRRSAKNRPRPRS